jgi:hypothetical protein
MKRRQSHARIFAECFFGAQLSFLQWMESGICRPERPQYESPGQRSGFNIIIPSPDGATQKKPGIYAAHFRAWLLDDLHPGRCPGLYYFAPLGLE